MQKFNPGDQVRFLDEALEGIVTRIFPDGLIGVTIEDDFELQVLPSQIVLLNAAGNNSSRSTESINRPAQNTVKVSDAAKKEYKLPGMRNELYWVCIESENHFELYISNFSPVNYHCSIYKKRPLDYELLWTGELPEGKSQAFFTTKNKQLKQRGQFVMQALPWRNLPDQLPSFIQENLDFESWNVHKADHLTDNLSYSWRRVGHKPEESVEHNPIEPEVQPITAPDDVVDLHSETLNLSGLDNDYIVKRQMEVFIHTLESAMAFNKPEITFIHGVGNGVLRNLILLHLKNRKDIFGWEAADSRHYGHGAIKIFLHKP